MENSYTTLHRNLDNRILTLEKETHPNQTLIKDLKKQKLRLKDNMVATVNEQMDLFEAQDKERKYKQLQSMKEITQDCQLQQLSLFVWMVVKKNTLRKHQN